MGIIKFINDDRFNVFFSIMLGIGLVALFRPICSGAECNVTKAPVESDFDKHVYRMGGKCHEFKTQIIECPSSGMVESFEQQLDRQNIRQEHFSDSFCRRNSLCG